MHDLQNDLAATFMDGIGHLAPGGNLLGGLDTRLTAVGLPGHTGPGTLGHNQPRFCTGGIMFDHQFVRRAVSIGAVACHRCHHNAVLQLDGTDPDG